jgi:hypothetical protein
MGYVSAAQRKAVWASKKDGGKGNPNKKGSPAKNVDDMTKDQYDKAKKISGERRKAKGLEPINISYENRGKKPAVDKAVNKAITTEKARAKSKADKAIKAKYPSGSPFKMQPKSPLMGKISASCKARAKKKFKVWPSAYASGWGVRCTRGDFD